MRGANALTNNKLPIGKTMKRAHAVAKGSRGAEIVKPRDLINVRYAGGASPSLFARRSLNLMIGKAEGNAWRDQAFSITKGELRRGHKGNERIEEMLDELMTIKFKLDVVSPNGRPAKLTAALLASNIEEYEEDDRSLVWFRFTDEARAIFQDSNIDAVMNRAAVLAFESKYSITLYEIGALVSGKRDPTVEYSVQELRERLGVPPGSMMNWADLKRRTLDQAKAEIDQLAHFTLDWQEKRYGRKVVGVELRFWRKDNAGITAAADELDRHSAGRRERRQGTAERMIEEGATIRERIRDSLAEGSPARAGDTLDEDSLPD